MCANFWWVKVGNERKIHWKSWNFLSKPKTQGGMGFQDIWNNNLAMLAKQGWRLLQHEDSLVHKCFKAKYFPRCSFLDAGDVPNSSYVWKNMLAAQPILKQGCCWRVGNRSAIQVLKDKWLPNHPTNRVLHPPLEEEWEWRVDELIDWTCCVWDRQIIEKSFHREDAEAILRIPLSHSHVEDVLFWLYNKNGEYSVKSGYQTAKQIMREEKDRGECSKVMDGGAVWRSLWKLHVPNKIKVFAWRALHDILPTRENLARRRIVADGTCELCQRENESVIHAL